MDEDECFADDSECDEDLNEFILMNWKPLKTGKRLENQQTFNFDSNNKVVEEKSNNSFEDLIKSNKIQKSKTTVIEEEKKIPLQEVEKSDAPNMDKTDSEEFFNQKDDTQVGEEEFRFTNNDFKK